MIRRMKSILRDRAGTAGIEFAITAPVIILLFLGGVTLFDIFRSYQKIIEANSVVADLISRQTSIDKAYFDTMYGVFTNLQADPTATRALRVSSVTRSGSNYVVAWSKVAGSEALLPTQNSRGASCTARQVASAATSGSNTAPTGWYLWSNRLRAQSNWMVFMPGICSIDTVMREPACSSSARSASVKPRIANLQLQ